MKKAYFLICQKKNILAGKSQYTRSHVTFTSCIKRVNEHHPCQHWVVNVCQQEGDDRSLLRLYKSSMKQTIENLRQGWHIDASPKTIRIWLKEQDIKCYSITKNPHLSLRIIQQRWSLQSGAGVLSGETNTHAEPNGGHRKAWRKSIEGLYDIAINTSRNFPTASMVWGCISVHGLGSFHVL